MTREDIVWVAFRVAVLYLLVLAVEATPAAVGAINDRLQLSRSEFHTAIADVLAPLTGALVLFEIGRRKPVAQPAAAIEISITRENLLWVCCKGFGLYYFVQGAIGLASVLFFIGDAEHFGGVFMLVGPVVASAVLGAWLLFGEQLWRWACSSKPIARSAG